MPLVVIMAVIAFGLYSVGNIPASPVQDGNWRFVTSADFDGDGRPDTVQGKVTDYLDVYSRIRVKAATGATLLDIVDQSLFYEVRTGKIAAPLPILLVGAPSGNWLQIEAFIYQPAAGAMQHLSWDGEPWIRGRQPQFGEDRLAI